MEGKSEEKGRQDASYRESLALLRSAQKMAAAAPTDCSALFTLLDAAYSAFETAKVSWKSWRVLQWMRLAHECLKTMHDVQKQIEALGPPYLLTTEQRHALQRTYRATAAWLSFRSRIALGRRKKIQLRGTADADLNSAVEHATAALCGTSQGDDLLILEIEQAEACWELYQMTGSTNQRDTLVRVLTRIGGDLARYATLLDPKQQIRIYTSLGNIHLGLAMTTTRTSAVRHVAPARTYLEKAHGDAVKHGFDDLVVKIDPLLRRARRLCDKFDIDY